MPLDVEIASTNKMHTLVLSFMIAMVLSSCLPALAQSSTTLHNPLIPGAPSGAPFQCAPEGPPPPPGDGPTPAPVTPGMSGPPTLMPWVTAVPANQIDIQSSGLNLPVAPPVVSPPGVLGPALSPFIPPPPSTPGPDPGMVPGTNGYSPPVSVVNVNPGGGLSGQAPINRWHGQSTKDFGPYRTHGSQTTDFGQDIDTLPSVSGRGIVRSTSQDGPRMCQQSLLPGSQTTQDLHGNRTYFRGSQRAVSTLAPY